MRFSVVINTYNRAASLRSTLHSLSQQTYSEFEVVVVNGPSTDSTDQVLAEFDGHIKVLDCPERRLAVSRNLGITAAAGEVVAFIDDDSLATPTWLEELAAAFDHPSVGAVGGLVYDPSGVQLQYRYAACQRNGSPVYKVEPPLDQYLHPNADPVAYLQGTNMAYSRSVLREIGGFDERILHFYDDVDVCLRVIDLGYRLKQLDGAAVHHKFLASHVRDHKRMTLDPYNQLCDRIYFGLKHGNGRYSQAELIKGFVEEADRLRREADHHRSTGAMTADQREFVHRRVDDALREGVLVGVTKPWVGRAIPEVRKDSFVPFPVRKPTGTKRLRVGFISREYPPGDFGGPGRYTHELAGGFAAAGHEVHVITRSPDIHRVDLEEGAWVHRLPATEPWVPELQGAASAAHIFGMTAAYHEVCRIHAERPLDIVLSPLWLCEGLVAALDDRFATAVTVITAMKAVSTLAEWARSSPEAQQLARLEQEYIDHARYLHAISGAIRDRAVADYSADPKRAFVAPLGVRDRAGEYQRKRRDDGKLRILYVGRLETRKGADVFLEAAARLGKEFPHTEFVLAGKELPTEQGDTHRQRFEAQFAHDPEFRTRVTFTGIITDDELYQHYADCDIFCLPTHYESFGLVFVEAMMWGKPLVGSRVGGVPEVVADGEQGFLCPVGDTEAITQSLRLLIVDPELRARFGRRSRDLYEQKWEMSVAVARMAREFEGVVRRHADTTALAAAAPTPFEQVQARFAAILERVLSMPSSTARAAAGHLFDPRYRRTDLPRHLVQAWDLPPPAFVETVVYRLLLDRAPMPGEEKGWFNAIANGMTKVQIIDAVIGTDDFRRTHGSWKLEELLAPDLLARPFFPSQEPRIPQPLTPSTPAAPRTWRQRLRTIPVLGKSMRYVKSVIELPWLFRKFFDAYPQLVQVVNETADRQFHHGHALRSLEESQLQLRMQLEELRSALATTEETRSGRLDAALDVHLVRLNETEQIVRDLSSEHRELQNLTRTQISRVIDALDDIIGYMDHSDPGPVVMPIKTERKDAG
jgi:hypothetical protein